MKIILKIKDNYGTRMYYPACATSEAFTKLLGTKTLTVAHLKVIKSMGYEIATQAENFLADLEGKE